MNSLVADFFTRIRNADIARHPQATCRHSNIVEAIATVLKKRKYITDFTVKKFHDSDNMKNIQIDLNTEKHREHSIKMISKPGRRVYKQVKDLRPVQGGLGIAIISTPKGVMTHIDAIRENVGGEVLCEVW